MRGSAGGHGPKKVENHCTRFWVCDAVQIRVLPDSIDCSQIRNCRIQRLALSDMRVVFGLIQCLIYVSCLFTFVKLVKKYSNSFTFLNHNSWFIS